MAIEEEDIKKIINEHSTKVSGFVNEFKKFAVKGNVVDLAVGIIIGTAFNNIVQALVKDIITPPIGFFTGKVDFANQYINLSGKGFPSIVAAQAAGAPVIAWGDFLNVLINFFIVSLVIFIAVQQINKLKRNEAEKPVLDIKDCPYCLTSIKQDAVKCPSCTSDLALLIAHHTNQ